MASTLAEIRAKLKAQDNGQSGNGRSSGDNSIFPFWNMEEGQTTSLRFLPDDDPDNTFFWRERLMIRLPFNGVKGQPDSRPVMVQVPCMEMYGENCPILTEVREWFKDKSLEDMGRKYWKKRSYLFQGFVVDTPIKEDSQPENIIRRFTVNPQLFNVIKQALMDPDMEEVPTDYVHGIDFRINKTSKGGYADYSTSNWARRERPLNDDEKKAIEEYGLYDLKSFLPRKPDDAALAVIKEMFEASVDGEAYDPDRWSNYYRPSGMRPSGDPAQSSNTEKKSPQVQETPQPLKKEPQVQESTETEKDDVPFTPDEKEESTSGGANDILAMIRARQNQQ